MCKKNNKVTKANAYVSLSANTEKTEMAYMLKAYNFFLCIQTYDFVLVLKIDRIPKQMLFMVVNVTK